MNLRAFSTTVICSALYLNVRKLTFCGRFPAFMTYKSRGLSLLILTRFQLLITALQLNLFKKLRSVIYV